MDKPLIIATDNYAKAGYPRDVEALLIVELDGTTSEVDTLIDKVLDIAKMNKASYNRASNSDAERLRFWKGRKAAFTACGFGARLYLYGWFNTST